MKAAMLSALLFVGSFRAQAQDKWSFERCVAFALEHNLTIKQSVLQKRLAELVYQQNQLSQLPTLNAGADIGYNFGRSINPTTNSFDNTTLFSSGLSLSAGANLFNFFRVQNNIKGSRYEMEASNFLLERARNDMSFNIANAFLQILLANEQVKIGESQVALSTSQLENTKKLVAAGSVPESNQADLEAQLARDSSTLVTARNQAVISVLTLKAILNLDFNIPFEPEVPANIKTTPVLDIAQTAPEMVFSAALSNQPQTKADRANVMASERYLAAARALQYPSLRAAGSLGTNYASTSQEVFGAPVFNGFDTIAAVNVGGSEYGVYQPSYGFNTRKTPFGTQIGNNFRQYIGLSLNIPILNGWANRSAVLRAKIDVENRELTQAVNRQQLRQDVYTAHANAAAALQKFHAAESTERASQKAFDFATKRYNVGLMNSVEYITTQTNLNKAQIDKVSALYDYIFKIKLLEFYRDQKITL
ncbi:TolC family protein [Chitinophaga horti]|uniref:TolC family protein n=1 Tax=Chitinophaga horti TaxID=2920382 RepID=A0ABY6J036_9BACT|nr:TolC family protein [Chitinophaga horti]UYQ93034.1 TolC family protein [Chitinophaga horti]